MCGARGGREDRRLSPSSSAGWLNMERAAALGPREEADDAVPPCTPPRTKDMRSSPPASNCSTQLFSSACAASSSARRLASLASFAFCGKLKKACESGRGEYKNEQTNLERRLLRLSEAK